MNRKFLASNDTKLDIKRDKEPDGYYVWNRRVENAKHNVALTLIAFNEKLLIEEHLSRNHLFLV